MELIAKISKGSRMDQVYIPKNRSSFAIGSYVVLRLIGAEKPAEKPYFYNIGRIEPIKLEIINWIIGAIDKTTDSYENIIITGSFLNEGFGFNDVDIIIIKKNAVDEKRIMDTIKDTTGLKAHVIAIDNVTLVEGLSKDPLYQMMLSRCIAKKRFIYKVKHEIDYKILDLHLLKSKALIDNFDLLSGNDKYYLVRNMIAIFLFLQRRKIDNENVDKEIMKIFKLKDIWEIKQNMLDKLKFLQSVK